jgi:hypothetical protein
VEIVHGWEVIKMEKLILILLAVFVGCAEEKAAGPAIGRGDVDAGGFDLVPSSDLLAVAVDVLVAPFDLAPVVADARVVPVADVAPVKADAPGTIGRCPPVAPGAYVDTQCPTGFPNDAGGATQCHAYEPVADAPVLEPCMQWWSSTDAKAPSPLWVVVARCAQCAGVRL